MYCIAINVEDFETKQFCLNLKAILCFCVLPALNFKKLDTSLRRDISLAIYVL